jgi:hypothetical protein
VFRMARPKLMSFGWFAWGYRHWEETIAAIKALPIYQRMLAVGRAVKLRIHRLRK